jgi:hypothetical protein
MWAVSWKRMGKHFSTERLIPGNQLIPWIRKLKVVNRRPDCYGDRAFMKNSNWALGDGDVAYVVRQLRVYKAVHSWILENQIQTGVRHAFVRKFRRQFSTWSVNRIRFVIKQRQASRRWRLYSVRCNYRKLQSGVIVCSYDLWLLLSNKSTDSIQNPSVSVTWQ